MVLRNTKYIYITIIDTDNVFIQDKHPELLIDQPAVLYSFQAIIYNRPIQI